MKLLLWGTGLYAERILNLIEKIRFEFSITRVVDKSHDKQGLMFEGCIIENPYQIDWKNFNDFIFVAIKENHDVINYLENQGIEKSRIYTEKKIFYYTLEYVFNFVKQRNYQFREEMPNELAVYFEKKLFQRKVLEYYIENNLNVLCKKEPKKLGQIAGILNFCLSNKQKEEVYRTQSTKNIKKNRNIKNIAIYYTRFFNGGVERVISEHIRIFDMLGYNVILFLDERNTEKEYKNSLNVEIFDLVSKERQPIEWYKKFYDGILKYKIDLIYCHCYLLEVPFLTWMVHAHGCKIFAHIHTVCTTLQKCNYQFIDFLYHQVDKVIVLSRVDELFWTIRGVKAVYLPNPIVKNLKKEIENKRQEYSILWIGRLEQYQKCIFDVVEIMQFVVSDIPDVLLHIVGDTDHPWVLKELHQKIENVGLEKNIIFHGYIKNPSEFYSKMKVFIMTSSFEGFPMVLIEAMNFGIPVVMYDIPYLEILRQSEGIEKVLFGNKKEMANKILMLLKNKKKWNTNSEKIKKSILKFRKVYNQNELLGEIISETKSIKKTYSIEDYKILLDIIIKNSIQVGEI